MKKILSVVISMSFMLSTLAMPVSFAEAALTLEYGDFYTAENISITAQSVSAEGASLGDTAVVELTDDGRLKAVGLGTATIRADGSEKTVTVSKANMALIMIAGQSNAAGDFSDYTLAPNATGAYEGAFFITNSMNCRLSTDYVTLDKAKYCAEHGGKMEETYGDETDTRSAAAASALARKLVDLWGMKVWVVNTAVNGSLIEHWIPGGAFHQKFIDYANAAQAAINANGHYILDESKLGYLWLQGCSNGINYGNMSMADYITNFLTVHEAFKTKAGMKYAGIWQVRAGVYNNGDEDFYMSGPRLAQYYMTNSADSEFSDIHMILDTDIWRYDADVKAYFENKYGTNDAFVARFGYNMPTTATAIKPDLHYRQPGYNELGDEGAINLANILAGEGEVTSAALKDYYGNPFGAEIKINPAETMTVVPVVSNLNYNASKNLTLVVADESVATVNNTAYTLTAKASGQTELKICAGEKVLATYRLVVPTASVATFFVSPADAEVTLNGVTKQAENGIVTFDTFDGTHDCLVAKTGYIWQEGTVTVAGNSGYTVTLAPDSEKGYWTFDEDLEGWTCNLPADTLRHEDGALKLEMASSDPGITKLLSLDMTGRDRVVLTYQKAAANADTLAIYFSNTVNGTAYGPDETRAFRKALPARTDGYVTEAIPANDYFTGTLTALRIDPIVSAANQTGAVFCIDKLEIPKIAPLALAPASDIPCNFAVAEFTDEKITVNVVPNPAYEEEYVAIVALYESDVLSAVKLVKKASIQDTEAITFSLSKDSREIDVRTMIWNNPGGMSSLCEKEYLIENGLVLE